MISKGVEWMQVTLELTDKSTKFIINNLYPFLRFMITNLTCTDGSNVEFTNRGEEMERLQEGRVLYFNEEDIESTKE